MFFDFYENVLGPFKLSEATSSSSFIAEYSELYPLVW